MDLLRSSILGQEFINYRKASLLNERERFSNKIRRLGMGYVPIIIDSVDKDISKFLSSTMIYNNAYYFKLPSQQDFVNMYIPNYSNYGRPFVYHMDNKISDILNDIELLCSTHKHFKEYKFKLGLEDGSLPTDDSDIGTIYKLNRNEKDKILYFLLTKEKTMFEYVLSIMNYLKTNLKNNIKWIFNKVKN